MKTTTIRELSKEVGVKNIRMEVIRAWTKLMRIKINGTTYIISKPYNKTWFNTEMRNGDIFLVEVITKNNKKNTKSIGFVRRLRFDETIEVKEETSIALKKEQAQKECDELWEELRHEYEKHEQEKRELDFNGSSYDDSSCISNILFNQQGA